MSRVLAVAGVVLRGWLRRKEGYILLLLLMTLQYAVASMGALGTGGTPLYLFDTGLLVSWLFGWVVAVHAGASELPAEESRGTVFLLLAKPLGRGELVLGKWLGAFSAVTLCALGFHLLAVLTATASGFVPPFCVLAQAFLLHVVSLGLLTAMALAFSTRLNRDAAIATTATVLLCLLLLVPRIPHLSLYARGWRAWSLDALYYILPHLELFDLRRRILHGYGPVSADIFLLLAGYGAAWTAALLLAAWLLYRRRRFARDRLLE